MNTLTATLIWWAAIWCLWSFVTKAIADFDQLMLAGVAALVLVGLFSWVDLVDEDE